MPLLLHLGRVVLFALQRALLVCSLESGQDSRWCPLFCRDRPHKGQIVPVGASLLRECSALQSRATPRACSEDFISETATELGKREWYISPRDHKKQCTPGGDSIDWFALACQPLPGTASAIPGHFSRLSVRDEPGQYCSDRRRGIFMPGQQ